MADIIRQKTLKRYLYALMLECLAPSVILIVIYGANDYLNQKHLLEIRATSLVRTLALQQEHINNNTRILLSALSNIQIIKDKNAEAVRELLLSLAAQNPIYAYLTLVDIEGYLVGSSSSTDRKINFSDRPQFKEAISSGKFVVAGFLISRTTGRNVLSYAMPVYDNNNKMVAVIFAGAALDRYDSLLSSIEFPETGRFVMLDRDGIRLYRFPTHASLVVGMPTPPDIFQIIKTTKADIGTVTFPSPVGDGKTLCTYVKLRISPIDPPYSYVLFNVDESATNKYLYRAIIFSTLALISVIVVSIVMIRYIGGTLIVSGLKSLILGTKLIASGNKVPVASSRILEFNELAIAFNNMVEELHSRDALLRENEEKYRRLYENQITPICIFDIETLKFIDVNDAFISLYGYTRDELLNSMTIHDITAEHEESDKATQQAKEDGTVFIPLRFHRKKDGTIFPLEIVGGPYSFKGRKVMFAIFKDISERFEKEKIINDSLCEKDILLREIHHRVKNNLAVLSSLLRLQARSAQDNLIATSLRESESRVKAMSLVHETLYQSDSMASIKLDAFLGKLVRAIQYTYSSSTTAPVSINIDAEGVSVALDQASPLGLLINELLTNSFKYAFPDGRAGKIAIKAQQAYGELELTVSDDGIGFNPEFDWRNTDSLGLGLVKDLVERQLRGSIVLDSEIGVSFKIRFKLVNPRVAANE